MIKMMNCDCMEFMRYQPDKAFDLSIVDPPYGIGMDGGNVGYKGFNDFAQKDWDKSAPPPAYFEELMRVSKNQIIWGGNYFGLPGSRGYLIWDKGEGFKGRSYAECELAWTSFDSNATIFKHDPLASGDYRGKIHPTQKPVALYKWLLTKYAKPGQTILDTHGGSGSIAIACHDLGFDLTWMELDADYYDSAVKRYQEYARQASLFTPEEIRPEPKEQELF